jgi:hypothetical protein
MAKGKLTDIELGYIEARYKVLTVSEIAKVLGRNEKTIAKAVDDIKVEPVTEPVVVEVVKNPPEKKEVLPPEGLKPNFIRKERGDGNITILTEQASQFSDEFKNIAKKKEGPHIHKPLGKK